MAATTCMGPRTGEECYGTERIERNLSAKRRVFVQTEVGIVLGMELDRNDNAHTVRRKVQLALNIPTEERSLIYGDRELKNDLSAVRNDSALLLARYLIHRSLSTPCFSPTGHDLQERDPSGPIEILGFSEFFANTKELVEDIVRAMKIGIAPFPIDGGLGGSYCFRNCNGDKVAIVKPTDEEPYAPNNPKGFVGRALGQPGLKHSVRVGETGFREVAAYLLDHDHFARVPSTALVKITHTVFNVNDGVNGKKHHDGKEVSKLASLQEYVAHDFDASDYGTSGIPIASVHRIGILDIRILNTDRHAGNILVRKLDRSGAFGRMELIPIDHGLCLPESMEEPFFEWLYWPQASIPFLEEELEYIDHLDPVHDCELLRKEIPMIREACLRVLVVCTTFLKEAAAFGLCLSEIGQLMSRQFGADGETPSELELLCMKARTLSVEIEGQGFDAGERDDLQFQIDCEEDSHQSLCMVQQAHYGVRNPFSKLVSKDKEDKHKEPERSQLTDQPATRSKPSMQKGRFLSGASSASRSLTDKLGGSGCYVVRLDELKDREWMLFLDKFQMLLLPAFARHKAATRHQKQARLGSSCRF